MARPANTIPRLLRFHVDRSGSCWLWMTALGHNGYAKTQFGGRTVLAHRVFYEHFKGPIPPGLQIDHLCRVRRCVNPEHLEAVTIAINVARSESPPGVNARKVSCIRGHPLSGSNLYLPRSGKRHCRACQADRDRRCREKESHCA